MSNKSTLNRFNLVKNPLLQWVIISLSLASIACVLVYVTKESSTSRDIAALSSSSTKLTQLLPQEKAHVHRRTDKLRGPLSNEIQLVGQKPEHAGDVFVLRGSVVTSDDLQNVDVEWSLPEGVDLVSGAARLTIASLTANVPYEFEITLRLRQAGNSQIHLVSGAQQAGARFADSVQFNSQDQQQIEADKAALVKSTEEYSPAEKTRIFH